MPTLYLMKQGHGANPLFHNHWALLVSPDPNNSTPEDTRAPSPSPPTAPDPQTNPQSSPPPNLSGTFIHTHGSLLSGFTFEAKRRWSQATCPEPYRAFPLGALTHKSTQITYMRTDTATGTSEDGDREEITIPIPEPDETEHGWILDPVPRSELERALLRAPPPGPSLRSAGATSGAASGRARLQDCQEWIRMALPHAVRAGFLVYNEGVDVDDLLSVRNQ
ncbi:hypothetical protein BDZ94DRAFT_1257668 [Collybia nuda]|uniref:Uncharacterized protein n=1 Tax=Collybia nuda TaxID=64659 RepID=A0A9P5Y5W0_9AGAR|nr:hypothetical protein BDZ94DRAFT_1257668 [Collybia nuda]